ncbi:DH domain-containing protein [Mycena indigotica]|uniref:DH domain-containing protein n=1 Tax=Mycena indigotica TaxID=2126181 RepID=A0A8H6W1R3_9AGAR|nr:DH domain-containing protein [Mycena indigotica]KAF7301817.1 DH domain-containing protein [Mycena indigotica]
MALNTSPRKVIPLSTGEETRSRCESLAPGFTKRVFFYIQDLVLSFGATVASGADLASVSELNPDNSERPAQRKRALTNTSALTSSINELVETERSYVKRLRSLKYDYADPLRNFARTKSTAIIPPYEAKTLFGNVDNLLPVNEAFLTDLEKMLGPNGERMVGGVGDVALRHFKELRGFEQYKQYYVKREEAQRIFEHEMNRKSSPFAAYIDRIKYQASESRNRVGLRELLINPVQRIPQYTLMFRTMMKHMASDDPQRAKLLEADELASKIALAELDEETKRAAIFHCLGAAIDGFPADLRSSSRRFVDCIDVEDIISEAPSSSSASVNSASSYSLNCTLFLFDDKLVIVKRPGNSDKSGRVLAGLDELDKLTKGAGIHLKKKTGMSFKGVVDVTEVVATDIGGSDLNVYLENPPSMDEKDRERWTGRPFRSYTVVQSGSFSSSQAETDKQRFLENLWKVQATYRARAGQSVVLRADEMEVESKGSRVTVARTYYNVYQRTAFLQEPKKTKIVVHIDAHGSADKIPFGMGSPPFGVIRLQPLAGGLCRYKVTSSDPSDPGEEDIVQTARVPARIVLTIHQFGLFEFRTGRNSLPATPTSRSKGAMFSLDAISKNLFNARPGSAMGDFFGGTVSSHRRTKSSVSRSSTYSQTTASGSLTRFSRRSNSTATTVDDDSCGTRSSSRSRNVLRKLSRSPGGTPEPESRPPSRAFSRSGSRSSSRATSRERDGMDYSDDDDGTILDHVREMDPTERDLAFQLALARKNSQNQHGRSLPAVPLQNPSEETIYEDDQPPAPLLRPSKDATPRPDSSHSNRIDSPPRQGRSHSIERRPLGPRSPSPLPPVNPPELRSMDQDLAIENTGKLQRSAPVRATGIPRSKRQPLFPAGNIDATPKPLGGTGSAGFIEPLSIKKKTSVHSSESVTDRKPPRNSPLSRAKTVDSPRRVSPQVRATRAISMRNSPAKSDGPHRLVQLSQMTKEDVDSSHRALKRIKLEIETLATDPLPEEIIRPSSPSKALRTPQRAGAAPMTQAAIDRLEEMRQLIGQRNDGGTPRRPLSMAVGTPTRNTNSIRSTDDVRRNLSVLAGDAEGNLARAASNHDSLQSGIQQLADDLKDKSAELERTRLDLQNSRRQCELVKSLLDDATAEKEIMYEAFNEELEGMYNDANLPDDEAWASMSDDLRKTKEGRNALSKENSQLKRRLAELELQQEEWRSLLKAHGLIP